METPPISCSPALRARTNIGMPPGWPNLTRRVGRIWKVTQPSGPVAASGGVVVVPKGSATTNTRAPTTEWLWLSEMWKRALNVCRERNGWGLNCTRWMKRRFGSDTSSIDTVEPLGAPAFATKAVGADVAELEPAVLACRHSTRRVVA